MVTNINANIIVSFDNDILHDSLPDLNLQIIDDSTEFSLLNILFPNEIGVISGIFCGMEYIRCGNNIEKIFYENSDLIPKERSIYKYFPSNMKIQKLREGKNRKDSNIFNSF